MSMPDSLPQAPPADWRDARFYRPDHDDCAVLEQLADGRGRLVSYPTSGPRRVLFDGSYGEAYEAWLQMGDAP